MRSRNKRRAGRPMGLMALLLATVLVLVACGGSDDPTPVPAAVEQPAMESTTAAPAAAVDAPASSGDAAIDAVANALRAQADNMPMRIRMGDEGSAEFVQLEIASPTRVRMDAGDMMLLLVDDQLFMRDGDEWVDGSLFASMANTMIANYVPSAVDKAIGEIDSAEQVADAEVDGEPTSVYQVTTSIAGASATESARFHVRKSDGLLVRVESLEDDVEDPFVVNYEYDASIVIEAP